MAKRPGVGDPAPDALLLNLNGRQVRLSARWRRRPLVAVFLRHFG
jgi:hypothetical protein